MPTVRVRVPATSANLGPGFDTLGLALNLYNYVTIEDVEDGQGRVTVSGEGEDVLLSADRNMVVTTVRHLLQYLGAPPTSYHLILENSIPLSRGLGSSSAAHVGALVAANEWAKRKGWRSASTDELITLATQLEGHPDNVAAAFLGGLVVSTCTEGNDSSATSQLKEAQPEDDAGQPHDITGATVNASQKRDAPAFHDPSSSGAIKSAQAVRMPVQDFPSLVVFIPETELATKAARAVLPDAIFRSDATFNVARTALLLAALSTGQWELLGEALQDKLHQEHRAKLMPGFHAMLRAAVAAGAYGATLSGAGPSVLAWLPQDTTVVQEVCLAIQDAAAEHEVFGRAVQVAVDLEGCVVVDG